MPRTGFIAPFQPMSWPGHTATCFSPWWLLVEKWDNDPLGSRHTSIVRRLFDKGDLLKRVLITRPEPGATQTAARLTALGLRPIIAPVLSIVAREVKAPISSRCDPADEPKRRRSMSPVVARSPGLCRRYRDRRSSLRGRFQPRVQCGWRCTSARQPGRPHYVTGGWQFVPAGRARAGHRSGRVPPPTWFSRHPTRCLPSRMRPGHARSRRDPFATRPIGRRDVFFRRNLSPLRASSPRCQADRRCPHCRSSVYQRASRRGIKSAPVAARQHRCEAKPG